MTHDLPEGHDSAEGIQRAEVSQEGIMRIRRARAVAKRSILGDMAAWCDQKALDIEKNNPGRKRGSVELSAIGRAKLAREIGDYLWSVREAIEVPSPNTVKAEQLP